MAVTIKRTVVGQAPTPNPRLLNTKEAAAYLTVSPEFLELRRCRGDGPPYLKIGSKAIRYERDALDEWLASQRRTNTSQEA